MAENQIGEDDVDGRVGNRQSWSLTDGKDERFTALNVAEHRNRRVYAEHKTLRRDERKDDVSYESRAGSEVEHMIARSRGHGED